VFVTDQTQINYHFVLMLKVVLGIPFFIYSYPVLIDAHFLPS
jgi:hypothetical protein